MIFSLVIIIFNVIALYESVTGLFQVMGLASSRNSFFLLTGTFTNPGPYGGCLAILIAVLAAYALKHRKTTGLLNRTLMCISLVSCTLCFIVLPATMSRAAWLGIAVAMVILVFHEFDPSLWIAQNRGWTTAIVVALAIIMTASFYMKKDSALGRLHIWHMELLAIADNPWHGHGTGTVLGVYGETQAAFFAEKQRHEIVIQTAGCPEYAFNEYLKVGVEHGVPAMLGLIVGVLTLISILLHFQSPFAYGVIVLAVFAFFSYPSECIHFKTDAEKHWDNVRYLSTMELYEDAVEEYRPLYSQLKGNYRFLYDYGYALHKTERYDESTIILTEGLRISSDPMFSNIIGKNYEALGEYEVAERWYLHAHYMVPCRLYPLVLLMELKNKTGDSDAALDYAEIILSMPYNKRLSSMTDLRKRAEAVLNEENR